ncbi:MAG: oligoribonuclease [Oligoflexales bacterium]|nr:oligoribonuclease [Oligoflexales bacterium]
MNSNLIWIDLEMSGLNPQKDCILEIASIVTNNNLDILADGISFAIRREPELFDQMDDWNKQHHTKSGLWQEVLASRITSADAQNCIMEYIRPYSEAGSNPLCGNSIWQDRRFLAEEMNELHKYLHYRIIDVSTVKELVNRWYMPNMTKAYTKKNTHRALDDILESINELKFYKTNFFKQIV